MCITLPRADAQPGNQRKNGPLDPSDFLRGALSRYGNGLARRNDLPVIDVDLELGLGPTRSDDNPAFAFELIGQHVARGQRELLALSVEPRATSCKVVAALEDGPLGEPLGRVRSELSHDLRHASRTFAALRRHAALCAREVAESFVGARQMVEPRRAPPL